MQKVNLQLNRLKHLKYVSVFCQKQYTDNKKEYTLPRNWSTLVYYYQSELK